MVGKIQFHAIPTLSGRRQYPSDIRQQTRSAERVAMKEILTDYEGHELKPIVCTSDFHERAMLAAVDDALARHQQ
jgi:hypothetical protein